VIMKSEFVSSNPALSTITVIIPAFNEGRTVAHTVEAVQNAFIDSEFDCKCFVIVDGPDLDAIQALADVDNTTVVVNSKNEGKGASLRTGIELSNSEFVAFFDADLEIGVADLLNASRLLMSCTDSNIAGVYGSKNHPDSTVNYPRNRRVLSKISRVLIKRLMSLDVSDSQTGLKVFRGSDIRRAVAYTEQVGYLFDLEIMSIMAKFGSKFKQCSITLNYSFNSSIGIRQVATAAMDMLNVMISVRKIVI
jgi:glycosyltransferase involved in cell wall biosynthesis